MGIRKDYLLREAYLTLALVKALALYERVLKEQAFPKNWVRASAETFPADLDLIGVGVEHVGNDTYNFTLKQGEDVYTCEDTIGQWQAEAAQAVEDQKIPVSTMARRCGLSRQSIYRILQGKTGGLPYLYTMRGRNPILLWEGQALAMAYRKVKQELAVYGLMEPLL